MTSNDLEIRKLREDILNLMVSQDMIQVIDFI